MYRKFYLALPRELIRDNPWWADPTAVTNDPHLRRLRERSLVFDHPTPFELDVDAAYTLRGPRQVGKTTLLKRLVRELIVDRDVSPRRVLYLDVGAAGIASPHALQEALSAYLLDVRDSNPIDRLYLFIDEVTGIDDWGIVLRTLHGRGLLEGVTFLATGSHALDVLRGGERAPGRRGAVEHWDWVMMPLSFRDYLGLHDPELLERLPTFDSLRPDDVFATAREMALHADRITSLFDRYLLTGGYPHPTEAEHEERRIPSHVYRLHQDAIRGEIARAGYRERFFRELVSWIGHHRLGREFSWRDASGETEIGSKDTARRYIEDAKGLFVWHVFYRVKQPGKPEEALRSPKKLYPADPFNWHVLSAWASGEHDPWKASLAMLADPREKGELVESVLADHFRRRFGHFAFYYRHSRGNREIDFVLFEDPKQMRLVEAKYRTRITPTEWKELAHHGGGILASRETLEFHEEAGVAVVPVSSLLAGLPYSLTLFPSAE